MTTLVQGMIVRGERVALREKRLGDAPNDYRWRREPDLARYDAARPVTMNYQEFLAFYQEELLYPNLHRRSLAIEDEGGRHIGNVMYYNIDALQQEAEVGITLGERDCWGLGYGTESLALLVDYLLRHAGFRRLHLKTLVWNRRAQRCFQKAGFSEYGRSNRGGSSFVLMELSRDQLGEADGAMDSAPAGGFAGGPQ